MENRLQTPENTVTVPVRGRMVSPDVLRVFACFSVIAVHFLWNSGFYNQPIYGTNMIIMVVMRVIFSPCVPMFIILTGYLSINKTLSKEHYAKGMKVVWLYLLASAAVIVYRIYIGRELPDLKTALLGLLSFTAAPYAWYVEMYIGLYLLIPFVNILYKNIPSQKWKLVLIIICFALNSLPSLVNAYNFTEPGWWLNPLSSNNYLHIMPQWWMFGYPLTYYLIGAYLREYGFKLGKITRWIIWGFTVLTATIYCLWRSGKGVFRAEWIDWHTPFVMICSTLLASIILEAQYKRTPHFIIKILTYLSGMTLQIYLVSYIFDKEYYKILKAMIPDMPQRLWSFFIIVPAVFLSSIVLSSVIDLVYRLFGFLYGKIKARFKHAEVTEPAAAEIETDNPNKIQGG